MSECEMMVANIDLEPVRKWFSHKQAEAFRETLYKKIEDMDRKGTHYGTEAEKQVWTREMWDKLSQNVDP